MGVIMYYPAPPKTQEALSKQVAAVHAQTVIENIKSMPCPVEQKAELIEAIKRIHQQRDGGCPHPFVLPSVLQSSPCQLADIHPVSLPFFQCIKGNTDPPGIFRLGHLTPLAHFLVLPSLSIVEEQIELVQQIRDRHSEQLRDLLHHLNGVIVPQGTLITGIGAAVQTGVVRHILLQQTALISVPPQLVRNIVNLGWIRVEKIELLRLRQCVGLDKPEAVNVEGA